MYSLAIFKVAILAKVQYISDPLHDKLKVEAIIWYGSS